MHDMKDPDLLNWLIYFLPKLLRAQLQVLNSKLKRKRKQIANL